MSEENKVKEPRTRNENIVLIGTGAILVGGVMFYVGYSIGSNDTSLPATQSAGEASLYTRF